MATRIVTLRYLGGAAPRPIATYTLNATGTVDLRVIDGAFQHTAEQPMKDGELDTKTRKMVKPSDGEAFLEALRSSPAGRYYEYL